MSLLELNPVKEPVVFSGLVTRLLAFYGVNTTKKPEKQEVVKHIILNNKVKSIKNTSKSTCF